MPRLFTGLSVPPEIGERLARFRGGLPDARWVEAGDYHVTLRFLGDIDADVAEDVLEEVLGRRPVRVRMGATIPIGDIFRRVVGWSVALLLVMCVLVTLQGTPVLDWMVPDSPH